MICVHILLPATLTSQGDDPRTILHAMTTLLSEIPDFLLKQGPLNDVPIALSSSIHPEHFRAWIPTQRPFRPKRRTF